MYDLTQLEAAGYQFTPLERSVFENPSFQRLYNMGWPIMWGSLTTGFSPKVVNDNYSGSGQQISFEPTGQERLTPHGAGVHFDDVAPHIRSICVLTAKVAREATEDQKDKQLVGDLASWLDGVKTYPYKPFRWAWFEETQLAVLANEARAAKVVELSQGDANVVVLLLSRLNEVEREIVREALHDGCVKRGILEDAVSDQTQERDYHMPRVVKLLPGSSNDRQGGRAFYPANSIVLVDCGDVLTIMADVPRGFKRLVKPVRFVVPKSTFRDKMDIRTLSVDAPVFPQMIVFDLSAIQRGDQRELKNGLEQGLVESKQRVDWWASSQVIVPAGSQKLNAILLVGNLANAHWKTRLGDFHVWKDIRQDSRITVDQVG